MTVDALFSIANALVLPGWLLLLIAPRWRWSARIVAGGLIPALLGLLYTYLVIRYFRFGEGGFGSLDEVAALFADEAVLLAGWIHYLALDLFVGAWEVRDARRLGISHLMVIPCLLLTFLFGPAGLLLYLVIRAARTRRFVLDAPSGA